jgi:hypothetical protein
MKRHFVIRLSLASVCLMFSFRAKAELTTKKTIFMTHVRWNSRTAGHAQTRFQYANHDYRFVVVL